VWLPAARDVIEIAADSLDRGSGDPNTAPSTVKVTVPVGAGTPGGTELVPESAEVNVSVCPTIDGLADEVSDNDVVVRFTLCAIEFELLPA